GNPGKPHEQGLYHDARAYLDWLQKSEGKKPSDIILVGESLGTGVALKMAEENPGVRAVILETPYTSLPAVAQKYYPFFPAHLIVRDKYNNLSRIGAVTAPILILHGRMDEIIPYDHAVKLKEEAGDNATLVTFDKGMHNDLYYRGAQKVIGDFLATLMTTPKT
ncbi:MAG: alpha/beta hydrolase, partial [Alphaproteobacteria bacterium]|nr:alpha/beta hydrolase [Alphaproteobacteria bacterium]